MPEFDGKNKGSCRIAGSYPAGVRLALLALSVVLAFAQAVIDNANNTSLTPLAPPTMRNKNHIVSKPGKWECALVRSTKQSNMGHWPNIYSTRPNIYDSEEITILSISLVLPSITAMAMSTGSLMESTSSRVSVSHMET